MTDRNRDRDERVEAWAIRLSACITLLRWDEGEAVELAKRTGGALRRVMVTREGMERERALEARRDARREGETR